MDRTKPRLGVIEVDPLFRDIFVKFLEPISKMINERMGMDVVIPNTRGKHTGNLGKNRLIFPVGMRNYGASALVRLITGAPKDILHRIKQDNILIKNIADMIYMTLQSLGLEIIAFDSRQCRFNSIMVSQLGGHWDNLLPKWRPGTLGFRKFPEWFLQQETSFFHSANQLRAEHRQFVDEKTTVDNYFETYNEHVFDRIRAIGQTDKEIILLDDTFNTGISMGIDIAILRRLGIAPSRIHALTAVNERRQDN